MSETSRIRKGFYPIAFLAALALELLAIANEWNSLRYFTKPLLLAILIVWVAVQRLADKNSKSLLLSALIFSWLGDIFLLFDNKGSLYFIFGLLSFLLAHVGYILLFLRIKKQNQPARKWNGWIIIAMILYAGWLFYQLYPSLDTLKIPVAVYAVVLCSMLVTSIHAFDPVKQHYGLLCVVGAGFFVISDSLLAVNKFLTPFSSADLLIMLTYAIAQLLIVYGLLQYLHSSYKS